MEPDINKYILTKISGLQFKICTLQEIRVLFTKNFHQNLRPEEDYRLPVIYYTFSLIRRQMNESDR